MTNHIDLNELRLRHGIHADRAQGVCLLEAVAWWAHEPHSDRPECVSPVLAAFGRAWNDGMRTDEERDQLKRYVPRLVGTAGDAEADERRAWLATDWLVRVCAPAWLLAARLGEHADRLEVCAPLVDAASAAAAQPVLEDARLAARAASWDAVMAAARDASRAASRAAARDASRAASRAASRDASRAASRDASWDASWDAARAASWAASWAALWDASSAASRAASRDAVMAAVMDAACDAAGGALEPTVAALQASAHDLFDRMIDVRTEVAA